MSIRRNVPDGLDIPDFLRSQSRQTTSRSTTSGFKAVPIRGSKYVARRTHIALRADGQAQLEARLEVGVAVTNFGDLIRIADRLGEFPPSWPIREIA